MPRNVLVVTTVVADEARLREQLRDLLENKETVVRIVAPATQLSRIDWLTGDEDRAREDARQAAERTAGAVRNDADVQIDRPSHVADAAQAATRCEPFPQTRWSSSRVRATTRAGSMTKPSRPPSRALAWVSGT